MVQLNRFRFFPPLLAVLLVFLAANGSSAKAAVPRVPKWQRWELTLKSSVAYTNPLQQTEMRVLLVSPLGETNWIYGFWDGGKEWKIRFKPGFPGTWRYYTMCSDTANTGLHGKTGEFLCTAPDSETRFSQHGPVQVARDQQHLEHADRTPFFWLGDVAWQAAIKSAPADWLEFVQKRAEQKFNAVQWQLASTTPDGKTIFYTNLDSIAVNPIAFRQLDAKIVAANKAGLLNAVAPLWEIGATTGPSEDQAIRLLRYVVARWGAEDVVWIIAFESDSTGEQARRWQNIGRAVFNPVNHAPVVLLPGESFWVCDAFRREKWVGVLGAQTSSVRDDNQLPWLLSGPLAQERHKKPTRPLIGMAPPAEGKIIGLAGAIDGNFARQQLWWNALLNTSAGVSYAAKDVSDWVVPSFRREVPAPWREALTLPGATAIASLAENLATKEFWKLQPVARAASGPNASAGNPNRVVVTTTEAQDLTVVYQPEAQAVTWMPRASSQAIWLNPRTGERHDATSANQPINPPSPGDWVLIFQTTPPAKAKKPDEKIDKQR